MRNVASVYNSELFDENFTSGQPPVSATLRSEIAPPYPHRHRHDDRDSKPDGCRDLCARARKQPSCGEAGWAGIAGTPRG
jgi:hypothetical protein